MGSLPVLEAVYMCSNSDNVLNLNHKDAFSNGAFFSLLHSLCLWVCVSMLVRVCVSGPKTVTFNNMHIQVPTLSK